MLGKDQLIEAAFFVSWHLNKSNKVKEVVVMKHRRTEKSTGLLYCPEACRNCHYRETKGEGCRRKGGRCRRFKEEMEKRKKCEKCLFAKGNPCTGMACYSDLLAETVGRRA